MHIFVMFKCSETKCIFLRSCLCRVRKLTRRAFGCVCVCTFASITHARHIGNNIMRQRFRQCSRQWKAEMVGSFRKRNEVVTHRCWPTAVCARAIKIGYNRDAKIVLGRAVTPLGFDLHFTVSHTYYIIQACAIPSAY